MGELNCKYIGSKAGILKLLTVIFGLIAVICIITGYYVLSQKSVEVPGLFGPTRRTGYFYTSDTLIMSQEEFCQKGYDEYQKLDDKVKATINLDVYPCPRKWMITVALIFAVFCLAVSLIFFIFLLIVPINKTRLFRQLDFIGHLGAALFLIVGGILLFVFVGFAFGTHRCESGIQKLDDLCAEQRTVQYQIVAFSIGGGVTFVNGILYLLAAFVIIGER